MFVILVYTLKTVRFEYVISQIKTPPGKFLLFIFDGATVELQRFLVLYKSCTATTTAPQCLEQPTNVAEHEPNSCWQSWPAPLQQREPSHDTYKKHTHTHTVLCTHSDAVRYTQRCYRVWEFDLIKPVGCSLVKGAGLQIFSQNRPQGLLLNSRQRITFRINDRDKSKRSHHFPLSVLRCASFHHNIFQFISQTSVLNLSFTPSTH